MTGAQQDPVAQAWDLSGSVALITVDNRGWGPVLAGALAQAGADVAVACSSQAAAAAAAAAVSDRGQRALRIVDEVEGDGDARGAVERVVDELGGLHILVNAAQAEFAKPFLLNTDSEWHSLLATNVGAVLRWCQAAGGHMVERGEGRIVNVISGLAERGLANSAAYAATQGAVQQITKSLALEWARSGVRVNAIGTGWFEAKRRPLEEQRRELLVRYLPLRRKGHPSDIGALLVYLASEGSAFVTGQTVFVDGGALAHA